MGMKKNINISVAEIAKAFAAHKKIYGLNPGPDVNLSISVEEHDQGLADVIKDYALPAYDSQSFNKAFIEIVNKGFNHNGNFLYDSIIYFRYRQPFIKYLNKIPEQTLQIGPGGSLGCEVFMCMSGVKNAYTLDAFPLLTFDLENFMQSMQKLVDAMKWLDGLNGFSASIQVPRFSTLEKGRYQVGEGMIQHIYPKTFEDTGFETASMDYLFSHATFEHVRDPLKCIREIKRVLKPGGLTAHCIDLRDHRYFDKPLTFLRESEDSWSKIIEDYCRYDGSGFMNRWRAGDFKAGFEKEGFEILEYNSEMKASDEMLKSEMPYMDGKFREMPKEDLAVTTLSIVARKI